MANIIIDLTYSNLTEKIDGVSTYTYKDIGTSNFKIEYKKENGKEISYLNDKNTTNIDLRAIKASIKNIFSFFPGQEILNPEFGNKLYRYIYQPMSDLLELDIKRTIKQMIQNFEPRIILTQIKIEKNYEEMIYKIIMKYDIPKLGIASGQILSMSASDGITFGD